MIFFAEESTLLTEISPVACPGCDTDDSGAQRLWCMNRGNANEINALRFSALNRKT
jgi:hypothetical protein